MSGPHADDPRRYMPPEARATFGDAAEPGPGASPEPSRSGAADDATLEPDAVHSRAYRFFHAAVWKYLIGGLSLLILLGLFGMMCSPVYWRF